MSARKVFFPLFLLGGVFLFLLFGTAKIWIVGDGVGYYAWVRSVLVDRDVDFANEFTTFNTTGSMIPRTIAPYGNAFAVGPALLWAPGYTVLLGMHWLVAPQQVPTGYEFPFVLFVSLVTILLGFWGLFITYAYLAHRFAVTVGLWGMLGIGCATPLIQYLFDEAAYAHVYSFFFCTVTVLVWLQYYPVLPGSTREGVGQGLSEHQGEGLSENTNAFTLTPQRIRYLFRRFALLGFLIGLTALMRWQQALLLILLAADTIGLVFLQFRPHVVYRGKDSCKKTTRNSVEIWKKRLLLSLAPLLGGITFFLAFSAQLVAWRWTFGSWFIMPQGGDFVDMGRLGETLLPFLFSPLHGVFFWHPVLLIGFVGLGLWAWQDRKVFVLFCFTLAQLLLLASVGDWWAGAAFGARRVVDILPCFALGLGYVLALGRGRLLPRSEQPPREEESLFPPQTFAIGGVFLRGGICLAVVWNIVLWLQYLTVLSHDLPLDVGYVLSNYAFLPDIAREVFVRSSTISLLSSGEYGAFALMALGYVATIVFGITIALVLYSLNSRYIVNSSNNYDFSPPSTIS